MQLEEGYGEALWELHNEERLLCLCPAAKGPEEGLCFQTCSHSPHDKGLCPSSQGSERQLSRLLGQGEETVVQGGSLRSEVRIVYP